MTRIRLGVLTALLLLAGNASNAAPMGYNISWQGSNQYSMAGMFSFVDSGQNVVSAHDLTSFMIEGFRKGQSIGSYAGNPGLFLYHPGSGHINPLLQGWNFRQSSVGFGCLLTGCGLTNNDRILWKSIAFGSKISVTPKMAEAALPEPATLGVLLAGLAAFGLRRRARS